jgi:hypothetical protein
LVTHILLCLEEKLSIENLIAFATPLREKVETADTTFHEIFGLLHFLSCQLEKGNADLISPQIVQESCTYMLRKLTGVPYP